MKGRVAQDSKKEGAGGSRERERKRREYKRRNASESPTASTLSSPLVARF